MSTETLPTAAPRRRLAVGPRRSPILTIAALAMVAYFLLPLWWLVMASTIAA